MKRFVLVVAVFILSTRNTNAQGQGFGMGVIAGEPTGISAKGWVSSREAIDAGLAWSFRGEGFIHAHVDYLWHFHDVVEDRPRVIPYMGVGGRIGGSKGSAVAGVRVPLGLSWWPEQTPLDIFFEIAPVIDLAPATELSVNGGIGIRFYFQ